MATVFIPSLLRAHAAGHETVKVQGNTVRQVVAELEEMFPGIRQRLCDGDTLRPGMAVVVDGLVSPRGLMQPVTDSSEVHFVPAIGGGAD